MPVQPRMQHSRLVAGGMVHTVFGKYTVRDCMRVCYTLEQSTTLLAADFRRVLIAK